MSIVIKVNGFVIVLYTGTVMYEDSYCTCRLLSGVYNSIHEKTNSPLLSRDNDVIIEKIAYILCSILCTSLHENYMECMDTHIVWYCIECVI